MNWDWSAVGSIGTAVAVLVAAGQVRRNTQQATSSFEDSLSREYRELVRAIPAAAYLGMELSDDVYHDVFPRLVQYVELSNEQVFLRRNGRVSRTTWDQWREGIQQNLKQATFARAWTEMKETGTRFEELRRLESSGFSDDPRSWLSAGEKVRQYWSR